MTGLEALALLPILAAAVAGHVRRRRQRPQAPRPQPPAALRAPVLPPGVSVSDILAGLGRPRRPRGSKGRVGPGRYRFRMGRVPTWAEIMGRRP